MSICVIRDYKKPEDTNFILNSWVKSYEVSDWAKHLNLGLFRVKHRSFIEKIIDRPDVDIHIAVNKHDTDQIYGYAIGQPEDCLHFIYCKKVFRGMGVGKELFTKYKFPERFEYSHFLPNFHRLTRANYAIYNPYRFFA